ncbi:MAG: hypothetical protein KI790_14985, partial [Cyclobacteriaceae bacterium]|nr:hypothetical protein [Cyclobacteriaceae bacterium HetDA_MAG_MS6]
MTRLSALFLFSSVISGCTSILGVINESDIARGTDRRRVELYYHWPRERRTPFQSLDQTIIQEKNANGQIKFNVYDVLRFESNSFPVDKEIFLLVDDIYFPIQTSKLPFQEFTKFSEESGTVATSDSTSIEVITGYNEVLM